MASARPLRHLDPPPPTRVRVRITGPDSAVLSERVVDDEWYEQGGYAHPNERQQVRSDTAATELREWLAGGSHPAGTYTVQVVEVDEDGTDTGTTWATVQVRHQVVLTSPAARP